MLVKGRSRIQCLFMWGSCYGPGLDIFEEMQFFPNKRLQFTWEHDKSMSCEQIYLWIESLCNLNAWHEGQHNGSQAYVYLPRASRGVYSNKLASVIIHPKVILAINPYKAQKVLVVYICSLKDKIHVCLS